MGRDLVHHGHAHGFFGRSDAETIVVAQHYSVVVVADDWSSGKNIAHRVIGSPIDAQSAASELMRFYASRRAWHAWPITRPDTPLHLVPHPAQCLALRHLCLDS